MDNLDINEEDVEDVDEKSDQNNNGETKINQKMDSPMLRFDSENIILHPVYILE